VLVEGEGRDSLPSDASNLIARALLKVYRLADRPAPGLELRAHNRIPLAAGLGSSAAALVSGLAAGNALAGRAVSPAQLLHLAAQMEGHAANAAAAVWRIEPVLEEPNILRPPPVRALR
jgi:homoserine kinase